jgi:hypothetical protein
MVPRLILLIMRNASYEVVQKIKTHVLCSITFFRKSCRLWDNVEKYGRTREVTGENITAHALCMLENQGYRHVLRICNTYCFSTATILTRTRLKFTFIRTLPVLFIIIIKRNPCIYNGGKIQMFENVKADGTCSNHYAFKALNITYSGIRTVKVTIPVNNSRISSHSTDSNADNHTPWHVSEEGSTTGGPPE